MSEPITASEARQILDVLKELQGDMKGVKSELQSLTVEVRVNQAKNDEQFKALNDKVDLKFDSVQLQIKAINDNIIELRTQQRSTDARLWAFVVGLVTLVASGVIKVLWFDRA